MLRKDVHFPFLTEMVRLGSQAWYVGQHDFWTAFILHPTSHVHIHACMTFKEFALHSLTEAADVRSRHSGYVAFCVGKESGRTGSRCLRH